MADRDGPGRAAAPEPLLAPTVALLHGFVFDEPAPSAARPRAGAAGDAAAGGETLLREGFRIGELRLVIRYEDGNELTDLPPVYLLPRAPAWFRGMANLHGALVPVFDPAGLFGVARDRASQAHAAGAGPRRREGGAGDRRPAGAAAPARPPTASRTQRCPRRWRAAWTKRIGAMARTGWTCGWMPCWAS